ncbi:chemosensory pili system protein ChpA (sensor histidine kinase/response regulator) [Malonomonas rubra DSM 5091]|uniref:histidine kinase n=1 Tax=Malonomonas rubra DSM 5091 TaxID=1122189 RepID=A0A1M6BFN2_MALRU|nr:hybrid sensor histidine kinase/response regulator [Malonomonas rubra]SHI47525.1 chemosensory pili system protein ChpA (sensor histidine kinase/response regulator) [Malonomonas rubra DSM 5091]
MSIIDSVFGFFVEEADEHLGVLENGLLQLEKDPSLSAELIEPLFRSAHTLKGSANLMNVTDVGSVAHRLEDLLEGIRDGEQALTIGRVNAMLFALDQMREMIHIRKAGEDPADELVTEALSRIALAESEAAASSASDETEDETSETLAESEELVETAEPDALTDTEQKEAEVDEEDEANTYVGSERRKPTRRMDESGVVRVGLDRIESLMGLVGEFTVTKNHLLDRLPVLERMKGEVEFAGQRLLKEVTGFAERYDYTMPAQNAVAGGDDAFDELEFDRYDELNLFSRKLREITEDIEEAMKEMSGFFNLFSQDVFSLDRMTDDMKEQISAARTVQAGQLFQRFNRSIRDLAQEAGKAVELCISGGETAIDRVVYDGLFDPLLHIVRNSFAHGIESEEERRAAGKPEKATIWLKAERRGNTVEVVIEDDGRGIDLERVRARGIEKGFIVEGDDVSEQDLIQLIFRPGFSTNVETDSVSGRGVGMNVVMDRLSSLNGTIDVWTKKGEGTRFRLRLPLSLVIVNVIQFSCCEQRFVIPSALVDEIVDLEYEARAESGKYTNIKQVDMAKLLKLPADDSKPGYGIVTQSEGTPIMLLVDVVIGQEDTVIKPFGSFLDELPYFSGSSLSGDGTMRLVVNPARMKHQRIEVAEVSVEPVAAAPSTPHVLVVDDSLSVRKFASLMLKANGFSVITAVNGQDALEKLDEGENVFSIITDLEMPIMHGYELLRELQNRGIDIPVAVLTSRAGEQHRQEALSLGASDYLVKPFDEEGLIGVVTRHQEKVGV